MNYTVSHKYIPFKTMKNSYIRDHKEQTEYIIIDFSIRNNSNQLAIWHTSSFLTILNTLKQFLHLKRNIFMRFTIIVFNGFVKSHDATSRHCFESNLRLL